MFCDQCGANAQPAAAFCAQCGARIPPNRDGNTSGTTPPEKRSNTSGLAPSPSGEEPRPHPTSGPLSLGRAGLPLAAGLLLFLLLGVGWIVGRESEPSSKDTPTQSSFSPSEVRSQQSLSQLPAIPAAAVSLISAQATQLPQLPEVVSGIPLESPAPPSQLGAAQGHGNGAPATAQVYLCFNIAGTRVSAPTWTTDVDSAAEQQVLIRFKGDWAVSDVIWMKGGAPYFKAVGVGVAMGGGFSVAVFSNEFSDMYVYNAGTSELFFTSIRSGSALLPNTMKAFRGSCKPAGASMG